MGVFDFLRRLFFGIAPKTGAAQKRRRRRSRRKPILVPLRRRQNQHQDRTTSRTTVRANVEREESPYPFARYGVRTGGYLDLSQSGDVSRLSARGLPIFHNPSELANWLDIPAGKLAWLIHRFSERHRPPSEQQAHYHYRWIRKRVSGYRLIEAPKSTLKQTQTRILREILDNVRPHEAAHGFVAGRGIVTNASPHVGSAILLKFDLENFYASVSFSRVVAVFRGLGYSREAALWLSHLTTSTMPAGFSSPQDAPNAGMSYLPRHLPQGAPTSPALANLSAFSLDVRLKGMAAAFGARYTRYADDITFSGPDRFIGSLRTFIPLVQQIIRNERFRVNAKKRHVVRDNQRMIVTGVVVNERTNVARPDYDRLKAILTNCIRKGPSTQNNDRHEDFPAHLRGRIAHVSHLNAERGRKLLSLFEQIDWRR